MYTEHEEAAVGGGMGLVGRNDEPETGFTRNRASERRRPRKKSSTTATQNKKNGKHKKKTLHNGAGVLFG